MPDVVSAMARFPHPDNFQLPASQFSSTSEASTATSSDVNVQAAKTWQWGTGKPIYKTTSTATNTGPRFDNSQYTQTGNNTRTMATQANIRAGPDMSQVLLSQDHYINVPMSPYERYMQDLINPRPVHFRNGQAVSSGMNMWENEHMYGRVQKYQESQNNADRAQALRMQQDSFGQAREMQNSAQAFQQDQAQRQYQYQQQLQQNGFTYGSQMQQNEFGQQRQMQSSAQQFQAAQSQRQFGYSQQLQSQNIIGNLANTATGGVFGLVGEGIHELGEYLNQKSNQNFQERMNPVLFQQQKQLQSASIKGNLENTGIQAATNFAGTALQAASALWMNHSNQEFQQAQATRNFNNQAYVQGLSANALKIAN